ncbi:MAG: hypothetical protein OXD54_16640 [Candidatus Poribacteria bacterium]|nr:hypothetical protein [Candidatus Poribacteria bacterium]
MRISVKLSCIMLAILVILNGCDWFRESKQVAQEELGPKELLRKYEWFKDASSKLDKKHADIKVYQKRITNMSKDYADVPRNKWPREDREQYNLWQSEVAGIKASYNTLASEYNAQMTKINWKFTNIGELPKGAETPLAREFKPYQEE